jgi:hypothetical protein
MSSGASQACAAWEAVAAVADADRPVPGRPDDLACPLVVEDVERDVGPEGGLVDVHAADLSFSGGEEGRRKVGLDGDVLIVEFGKELLVDVGPHPHEGELEEASHRRRHGKEAPAGAGFDVE